MGYHRETRLSVSFKNSSVRRPVLTGDVEEARQEAIPERTHLVAQTFVDLHGFGVEPNVFLLAEGEGGPPPSSVRNSFVGIPDEDESRDEPSHLVQTKL